ncbi:DUF1700 domain-containing protein [Asticcacaulis sp. YBE204]|uniref:DUF1700 domain-containing protein n=1 Tax=Asticcacaulis sp. YBE204 TaxID=1282363 RepID=UPI0003C3F1FC|nr:DUF1700 domain-containing protein [Asticcacaulis sp. YBE204]ESQ80596.1 membrane protein [Asticcacaulis sp. YBE204]
MTRNEFINRLKQGLVGLPAASIADIVADHEAHFEDGIAAGRSEAEVAAALGDPDRLARELRAEIGLKKWEDVKTPSSAVAAIFAVLGLGALDILVLLPILMGVAGTLVGFFMAAIGIFVAGGVVFAAVPFLAQPGGVAAALLGGVGLMAVAVTVASLTGVVTVWLVNGLVWFARLHYRLLKPALEPQAA